MVGGLQSKTQQLDVVKFISTLLFVISRGRFPCYWRNLWLMMASPSVFYTGPTQDITYNSANRFRDFSKVRDSWFWSQFSCFIDGSLRTTWCNNKGDFLIITRYIVNCVTMCNARCPISECSCITSWILFPLYKKTLPRSPMSRVSLVKDLSPKGSDEREGKKESVDDDSRYVLFCVNNWQQRWFDANHDASIIILLFWHLTWPCCTFIDRLSSLLSTLHVE